MAARRFLAIVDEGRTRSGRARIGVINREINLAIVPTSDFVQWGVDDRWSPPLETFTTGRGDCEDYAIAKYVALTEAGVPPEDVKLVVVRDKTASEPCSCGRAGGWRLGNPGQSLAGAGAGP